MKLIKVRIENFKCINDSNEFSIEPVTCLVGKNESGKTAILQALHRLNPDRPEVVFDALRDYPRSRYSENKDRLKTQPDNILTTEWELGAAEIDSIASKIGKESILSSIVTLKKGYDNRRIWKFNVDEKKIIEYFLNSEGFDFSESATLKEKETLSQFINQIQVDIEETEKKVNNPEEKTSQLGSKLESLKTLKKIVTSIFPTSDVGVDNIVSKILDERLPKFLYFSEYQSMPGQVSISDLSKRSSENKLDERDKNFLALLTLAGTTVQEIEKIGKFEELRAELEAISSRISREIFEYWSQNRHLDVAFSFDNARPNDPPPFNQGYVFRTRIWNNRHKVSVSFDDRSTGFVWFFSFLVWLSQLKNNYGENLFILLDEPALNLHAKAQADLLRYINERLKPNYQVIYTTHSPFMIDPDSILASRTVEDIVTDTSIEGTKVGDKIFSTDPDTIFPLQRVLGYEIAQTLFIGKNTLLVEGPSDILYLKWFSKELEREGKTALDPKWVLTHCSGFDKMISFARLFGANMLNIAAFVDFTEGQKNKIRQFRESGYIKSTNVLSAEKYANSTEADMEDILGRAFYIEIVNKCYGFNESDAIPAEKPLSAPIRVLKEVESHINSKTKKKVDFDHYAPAEFLVKNEKDFREAPGYSEVLSRFEKLFADLNALL
jgi:energy-coupling factor transporter ATP-binding protein EcfA2